MVPSKIIPKGRAAKVLNIQGHEPDGIWLPHRHDYYEVMWSLESRGHHCIDFIQYPLAKNRVFLISPDQVHDARQLKGGLRVVAFKSELFEHTTRQQATMFTLGFDKAFQVPYLDLDEQGAQQLNKLWQLLEEADQEQNSALLESLLSSYLRYLCRYKQDTSLSSEPRALDPRVLKIESLIEQHYRSYKRCDFYAATINLTAKRTNELMRHSRGRTVTTSIINRVCLEAKRELTFTTKSVQTIAQQLGYEDSSYFSRLFKNQEGCSPTDYRLKMFK
ncbi:putative AraC family transcriptional regulator [Vibrio halioticoli NBRC 102217]|uniref:Putative AraC family transcriptional regulator n=1 Tax=Vibrio halioticoli NBRC 102217 TaxID=1219072 RepID=V5F5M7_9VIBR|nr:helix-turn-helix domain-containing protein [Vibrio halioticoli]GAD90864.1 putative AraC family transcriptional regulator [Vibrio halioticoli NBRC 102217]